MQIKRCSFSALLVFLWRTVKIIESVPANCELFGCAG